jgi:hypothetical protein
MKESIELNHRLLQLEQLELEEENQAAACSSDSALVYTYMLLVKILTER